MATFVSFEFWYNIERRRVEINPKFVASVASCGSNLPRRCQLTLTSGECYEIAAPLDEVVSRLEGHVSCSS